VVCVEVSFLPALSCEKAGKKMIQRSIANTVLSELIINVLDKK
jgi:hypothetical protein